MLRPVTISDDRAVEVGQLGHCGEGCAGGALDADPGGA